MTINQKNLGELCARVASGDEQARRDFDRHVPPLVEIVVHRWLRQQRGDEAPALNASALNVSARRLTGELCARMIAENQPNNRHMAPSIDDTLRVFTTADTLCWA